MSLRYQFSKPKLKAAESYRNGEEDKLFVELINCLFLERGKSNKEH
jgi:hypothetical protein